MAARTHALLRKTALIAGAGSLLLTSAYTAGVASAAEDVEGSNNLSVPTLYVGSVGVGTPACTAANDLAVPTGAKGVDTNNDGIADDHLDYWVQGLAAWQADCEVASVGQLVTPKWGDNLTGAPLKVGTPVRIELGLMGTATSTLDTHTFNVVKLDADVEDRLSHYGTQGDYLTVPEVRVWAGDATYTIVSSSGTTVVPEQEMSAEINATGRVVYGEQYTFDTGGTYVVTFESSSVNFGTTAAPDHDTTIELAVSSTSGGGGKKQGGGGRPDNPGGGNRKPR